jgi:hypothetical protein
MRFQGKRQLQNGRKRDIDHTFFDLGDLAIINTASIRHFTQTEVFRFP